MKKSTDHHLGLVLTLTAAIISASVLIDCAGRPKPEERKPGNPPYSATAEDPVWIVLERWDAKTENPCANDALIAVNSATGEVKRVCDRVGDGQRLLSRDLKKVVYTNKYLNSSDPYTKDGVIIQENVMVMDLESGKIDSIVGRTEKLLEELKLGDWRVSNTYYPLDIALGDEDSTVVVLSNNAFLAWNWASGSKSIFEFRQNLNGRDTTAPTFPILPLSSTEGFANLPYKKEWGVYKMVSYDIIKKIMRVLSDVRFPSSVSSDGSRLLAIRDESIPTDTFPYFHSTIMLLDRNLSLVDSFSTSMYFEFHGTLDPSGKWIYFTHHDNDDWNLDPTYVCRIRISDLSRDMKLEQLLAKSQIVYSPKRDDGCPFSYELSMLQILSQN